MLEKFERPLRIVCLGLAALLLWQVANLVLGGDPLSHLQIPELPKLADATNGTAKPSAKESNPEPSPKSAKSTNAAAATNVVANTNVPNNTNVVAVSTNADATPKHGGAAKPGPQNGTPPMPPGFMGQMMGGGGGMKKVELPPEVQSRVDRIIESEFLGPVMHPMPMALLGILEDEAFIQATNGQTGPVKVGAEMGGLKLLRIGINRVLVEQGGQKSELMIFGGAGGESLMPVETNSPSTNSVSSGTNAPAHAAVRSAGNANANAPDSPAFASTKKETP